MHLILATRNLWQRKRHTWHIMLGLIAILSVLLSWIELGSAMGHTQDKILLGEKSACHYLSTRSFTEKDDLFEDLMGHFSEDISVLEYGEVSWKEYVNKEDKWSFVNISHTDLTCEGKSHSGLRNHVYCFENDKNDHVGKATPFKTAIVLNGSYIGENDLTEYHYRYPSDSTENGLLYGREISGTNEIMISDFYLREYGFEDEEMEELVGRKITISCEGEELITDYTLTGVIDSRVFYDISLSSYPQIIISGDEDLLKRYGIESWYMKYSACTFPVLKKIYEHMLEENKEMIGVWLGIEYATSCAAISDSVTLVRDLFMIFGSLIILAMACHVVLMICNDFREKKNINGMMLITGMEKKDLFFISLIELWIEELLGSLFGVAVSTGLLYAADQILRNGTNISLFYSVGLYIKALLITFLAIYLLFAMLYAFLFLSIWKKSPTEVLLSRD